jgi:hypothetical protein
MTAARHGVNWVGDASPDRMGWCAARNHVVKEAIKAAEDGPVDGIFWVDDDVMVPADVVPRLLQYGHDMVSGLYFQRAGNHYPLVARWNEGIKSFEFPVAYPEGVLVPVDGVGFGCVYTSLDMFRKIAALKDTPSEGPFGGDFEKRTYGEDFAFCLRARKAGIQPYVDTGILCEHYIGPQYATAETFQTSLRKALEEGKQHVGI